MTYQHVNQEERYLIYSYCKANFTKAEIARKLKRSKSTITREFQRNSGKKGYRPMQAHELAISRNKTSYKKVKVTKKIKKLTDLYIKEKWSPVQVSERLKLLMNISISHQTIYELVYEDKYFGGKLYTYLRQGKNKRRKKYGKISTKRGQIRNKRPINTRPKYIDKRSTYGHWEGDTIIGKNHQKAMITLVERKSGFVIIEKVESKNADLVAEQIIKVLKKHRDIVKTITFDNGLEFAAHEEIEKQLKCKVYFADTYSSYQRGTNENTNGLIRQYFPKGSDFNLYSQRDVKYAMKKLNDRPRKRLGFFTPKEKLFGK